jgi:hypothetical protein
MRHHLLQTCGVKLNTLENERHAYITEELHQPERKRVLGKFTVVEHVSQL